MENCQKKKLDVFWEFWIQSWYDYTLLIAGKEYKIIMSFCYPDLCSGSWIRIASVELEQPFWLVITPQFTGGLAKLESDV